MEPPSPTKPEADQGSNGAAASVRGPEPTEPGERILLGLSQVAVALKSQAWRDALPKGINPTQAQILVALNGASAFGEEGGLRLSALAERLAVSAPTVSDSVRALVEKGLVVKQKANDDGRALALALTDHGRELAADLAKWPPDLLASTVPLDVEEQGRPAAFASESHSRTTAGRPDRPRSHLPHVCLFPTQRSRR